MSAFRLRPWDRRQLQKLLDHPPDAKQWEDVPNKFEEHFSPNPGQGD